MFSTVIKFCESAYCFCPVPSYLGWCRIVMRCNHSNELHSAFRYYSEYVMVSVDRKRCILVLSLEVAVPGQLAWFPWGSGPEEYAAKTQGHRKLNTGLQGSRERRKCLGPKVIFKGTVLHYHFSLDPTKFSPPPNKVDRDQAINKWDPEGHLACV